MRFHQANRPGDAGMQLTRFSDPIPTTTTDSSGVLKLLFVVLILQVAMPLMAQQSKPDTPSKQSWRVIDDAPYRIIPAHPQLKTNGKTLKEWAFNPLKRFYPVLIIEHIFFSGIQHGRRFDRQRFI